MITVNLTGVTDAQRLGVTLQNVSNGTTTTNILIPMGVLWATRAGMEMLVLPTSAKPRPNRVPQLALGISAKM